MLAPCKTSRALRRSTLSSRRTSGRAAGIQMSQSTATRSSGSMRFAPCRSVRLLPAAFSSVQLAHAEPLGIGDRAVAVGGGDEAGAPVGEKPRGVPADRAEPLHRDARALELQAAELLRDLGGDGNAEPGRADLVERDAADLARQAHRAADLVLHPRHGRLVGAHVGAGDVLLQVGDGGGESAHQPLLLGGRHGGVAEDHGFGAAVGKAGRGVLEGHGAREAEALLGAHVRRHAGAADGRPRGRVVDDHDRLEPEARLPDVHDLLGAEPVGESEVLLHGCLSSL